MLIFYTIDKKEIAINPKFITSIINENEIFEDKKLIRIVTNYGGVYDVFYSDFQTLVRIVSEKQ
jgi:hypothetical protein